MDPVSAFSDDAGDIWVANAFMHYFYPWRGDALEKDDGQVLQIDSEGRHQVLVERSLSVTMACGRP